MAGPLRHKYRLMALREFGVKQKGEMFTAVEATRFLNEYKNGLGKPHRFTNSNVHQVGNLLKGNKEFQVTQLKSNKVAKWIYVGSEEE
tara:strand:- start:928 stop:1191 length:264 start_codon:yes stop_codon:yes gene_type:complete